MKNYAGSRLSPWLGHLMVCRQETARPLLTPGEVMQLPPNEEIVMVSGGAPVRAKKARYYEDARLQERILPPPRSSTTNAQKAHRGHRPRGRMRGTVRSPRRRRPPIRRSRQCRDPTRAGAPDHEEVVSEPKAPVQEFEPIEDEPDDDAQRQRVMQRNFGNARQISLDAGDDMQM